MNVVAVLSLILFLLLYMAARIMRPSGIRLSKFEIERRASTGESISVLARERMKVAPIVDALRWLLSIIFILAIDTALTFLTGWGSALVVTILVVIAVAWLERWRPIVRFGERLYARVEPRLNKLYVTRKFLFFLPLRRPVADVRIDSEAELLHLLDGATFLEPERRTLIHSALEFTGLSVRDAMSSRKSIKSVDKGEVVGPLVVDELYKTGKTAFVVIDGDIDTVVGVLKLERLTSLDLQDEQMAVNAMSPEVHFIDADAPVTDALSYLRSSKAPFLVVQDGESKTVGLLTMDNILRCLFAS